MTADRTVARDAHAAPAQLRHGAARLAHVFEQFAAPALASGFLERVLPEHSLVREAFYLDCPSRKQLPPKLSVFSAWLRKKNRPAT